MNNNNPEAYQFSDEQLKEIRKAFKKNKLPAEYEPYLIQALKTILRGGEFNNTAIDLLTGFFKEVHTLVNGVVDNAINTIQESQDTLERLGVTEKNLKNQSENFPEREELKEAQEAQQIEAKETPTPGQSS